MHSVFNVFKFSSLICNQKLLQQISVEVPELNISFFLKIKEVYVLNLWHTILLRKSSVIEL